MKKILPIVLLILLSMFINIFFRLYTMRLPFTLDMARDKVYDEVFLHAQKDIQQNFPDLPQKTKERLTDAYFNKILKSDKKSISLQIKDEAKKIREFWQDEHGQTYLLEIDPYHWMRLTQNILNFGRAGDIVKDGIQYDTYMLAPFGKPTKTNLHIYVGGFIYKIWHKFNQNIYLMKALFFVPVFLSILVAIPIFFICLKIGTGNFGALFASITLGLAHIFLERSMAGWYDTDTYNIILPLTILWMFIYIFEVGFLKRLIFIILSALFVGVYAFSWDGWWYIFDMILLAVVYQILNTILSYRNKLDGLYSAGSYAVFLFLFFLFSAVFVSLFSGLGTFKNFYLELIRVLSIKKEILPALWPNVFLTVAELKEVSVYEIIQLTANRVIFAASMAGLLRILIKAKISKDRRLEFMTFLLTIWIATMLYVSTKSIRFSLLLCVPVAVGFGIFIGSMTSLRFRPAVNIILILVLFIPIYSVISSAGLAKNIRPLMNDDWWGVLQKIKKETPDDAVINSWWDYGHWFKAVAGRRVIFDGATQNTPLAYWMAHVLLTQNEDEAVGILRMLNCGSDRVVPQLESQGLDIVQAVDLTLKILPKSWPQAKDILQKRLPNFDSEDILKLTHGQTPPVYFITEKSLIEKIISISFLGNWDFQKADIWRKFKQSGANKEYLVDYLIKHYQYNRQQAVYLYQQISAMSDKDILDWISPSLRYYPLSKSYAVPQGKMLYFDNGLIVNLETQDAFILDSRNKIKGIPKSLVYPVKDGLREVNYKNSNLSFSILLVPDAKGYLSYEMDSGLTKSMLTRLYFLKGHGLKYFKPYIKNDSGQTTIYVWQIDWQGKQANNVFK